MKEFDVEVDTGLIQMGGFGNAAAHGDIFSAFHLP